MLTSEGVSRRWRLSWPVDLGRTLGVLRRGAGDPTMRLGPGGVWRACLTPDGPGTLKLGVSGDELVAVAWGTGADWLIESVPDLIGESDDWSTLDVSHHPVLHTIRRRYPNVRLCRTGLVLEALVPACLEQRVTGREAWRGWRSLVRGYGQPAPGPAEPALWVMPSPARLLEVPTWDWHRFGVDAQRYQAIRAAATVATRLEECVGLASGAADLAGFTLAVNRLRIVPGIGEWTAAETAVRALGHPDAVSVGDFHLKNLVGFALTGAPRTDDETMLELLEPWRGQRARVVRLIELGGHTPPRFGPRFNPNDIRAI
jgi:3-methyladenine DNA glycosylase/8-oxoguanine DNA glycosylase